MSVGMTRETATTRATRNFSEVAGETVYVYISDRFFDVFCTELAMYRLNDQYPVVSKGFSKTHDCWYVSIKHNLPKGFIQP